MSLNKCCVTECENKSSRTSTLMCKSICKRIFHGACLKLEPTWTGSRLIDYYICEDCQEYQGMIRKLHDSLLNEFKRYVDEDRNLLSKATKALEVNNEILRETDVFQSSVQKDDTQTKIASLISDLKHEINGQLNCISNKVNTISNTVPGKDEDLLKDLISTVKKLENKKETELLAKTNGVEIVKSSSTALSGNSSGWRFVGNVKKWRNDWTDFDRRASLRKEQEKSHQKAVKRKKQLKKQEINNPNNKTQNKGTVFNRNDPKRVSFMHKQRKLDTTTSSLEMTMPAAVRDSIQNYKQKYNEFVSGGIYQPGAQPSTNVSNLNLNKNRNSLNNSNETVNVNENLVVDNLNVDSSFIDLTLKPMGKLTHMSCEQDMQYATGRLHDSKLRDNFRKYLAYFHDLPPHVCQDGVTRIELLTNFKSEGYPTDYNKLKKIYIEYMHNLNFAINDVEADLKAYRSHLKSERLSYLRDCEKNYKQFYGTTSKNF